MTELEEFLATVDVLHDLTPDERRRVSLLCRERSIAAGARLLEQGGTNSSLLILRSGQLVVRARRDEGAETVAQLSPPAVVGEISFLTGRRCAADVDVAVDAAIVELPRSSLTSEPACHDLIVRALSGIIAHRLHDTIARPVGRAVTPVVLVRPHPSWGAPRAFIVGLARALASATNADALLIGPAERGEAPATRHTNEGYWEAGLDTSGGPEGYRRQLVEALPQWSGAFGSIVLTTGDATGPTHELVEPFATHVVDLVGPASRPPEQGSPTHFVLQDARAPSLTPLTVRAHLVFDVAAAEQAHDSGLPFPERFSRSVSSVARAITGASVGLALGAGGARGWAHIGILEVLARERFPIDVVTGASMGAIVGGLLASGVSPFDLRRVMKEWHRRRRRLREMRFWRMHMASERGIEDLLRHFFGNRTVTTTEIPYAANAVDIESGEDVVIGSGLVRHAARASMAYPGWLPPYVKDGRVLVDGATLNPVPAGACRTLGADFVIAVNVLGLNGASPLPQRWPRRQFEMMSRVFHLCTYAMSQMRSEAASDIVIMPNLGDATMLSFDRFDEMVDAGRRVAEEQVPAIIAAYSPAKASARR